MQRTPCNARNATHVIQQPCLHCEHTGVRVRIICGLVELAELHSRDAHTATYTETVEEVGVGACIVGACIICATCFV